MSKPLPTTGARGDRRTLAVSDRSAPRRIPTDNLRIKSQSGYRHKGNAINDLPQEGEQIAHPVAHTGRKAVEFDDSDLAQIVEAWPLLPEPIPWEMLVLISST